MAQLRALIVDDQPRMREYIETILSVCGFACSKAADGLEALRYAEREINLIITDIEMPNMDGVELLGLIKRGVFQSRPSVVICSGLIEDEAYAERFEWFRDGAKLPKPFSPGDMISAVHQAIDISQHKTIGQLENG